jgi:hypothetical protein
VSEDEFRRLMHEETIIVEFERDRAKRALPKLLRSAAERRHAHELLDAIEAHFKLEDRQRALIGELRGMLPVSGGKAVTRPRAARRAAAPKRPGARSARNGKLRQSARA